MVGKRLKKFIIVAYKLHHDIIYIFFIYLQTECAYSKIKTNLKKKRNHHTQREKTTKATNSRSHLGNSPNKLGPCIDIHTSILVSEASIPRIGLRHGKDAGRGSGSSRCQLLDTKRRWRRMAEGENLEPGTLMGSGWFATGRPEGGSKASRKLCVCSEAGGHGRKGWIFFKWRRKEGKLSGGSGKVKRRELGISREEALSS